MKGWFLPMKHTARPTEVASPSQALLTHVLSFFEMVLDSCESQTRSTGSPGRPASLTLSHLLLVCVRGLFERVEGLRPLWRLLLLQPLGSFAPVQISYQAVRQRLLSLRLAPFRRLLAQVNCALQQRASFPPATDLAPFAPQIVALDETTLDAVARLCDDTEHLPASSRQLLVGKLVGLFDIRRQHWLRLEFRSDVLAHCKTGALLLLEELAAGSLIVADLGYFGFAWFDYLTQQGYWWLSRLKPNTSYELRHIFYEHDEVLDALIWLGTGRNQAAHACRLVQFRHGTTLYRYVTNVIDPLQLSLSEIAQLYARRWDIELAFRLLKEHLQLRYWWACEPILVLQQLWLTLIVAQVLHHLQAEIAARAGVDPFDVSLPTLLEVLTEARWPTPNGLIATLVERGPRLGLIRPHRRLHREGPQIPAEHIVPLPARLTLTRPARRVKSKRPRHPRTSDPFQARFVPLLIL
ncbi:MAG: hypothetical protein NVSMB49_20870 [Ktedonobacteraceae bacterium]